jgi:Tfp pilus assembly protein PilE
MEGDLTMRNAQRGVTLMGLIVGLFIVIVVTLFAMKVIPSFLEYRTAKAAIEAVASQAQSPADVRRLFESRTAIDNISLKPSELEISREGNQMVVAFAYRKEVPLFGNVGLYIDYAANSKGSQ